jgi:hypothetical protein
MRTRLIASIAVATLALAGCGGDDGSSGQQGEVADLMLATAEEEGIVLEEDCVREVAGRLSDEDAAKIVEAGVDGDPDVSDDAEAVAEEMADCVDTDALVDQIVAEMDGEGIDAECLKRVLDEEGITALESGAIVECIDLGG